MALNLVEENPQSSVVSLGKQGRKSVGEIQKTELEVKNKAFAPFHSLLFYYGDLADPLKWLVSSINNISACHLSVHLCLSLCACHSPVGCPNQKTQAYTQGFLFYAFIWLMCVSALSSHANILCLKHRRLSRHHHQKWKTANWALPNNLLILIKSL